MQNEAVPPIDLRDPSMVLPERVELRRELAGIGARALAFLLDGLVRVVFFLALFALVQLLVMASPAGWGITGTVVVVILIAVGFLLNWAYFVVFEMLWAGQTPGKRIMGLRVERVDGLKPRFWQSAVRNLLRIVDSLPWGYGLGLAAAVVNTKGQRLGDTLSDTMVVSVKKPLADDERQFALVDLPVEESAARAGLSYEHWELLQDYRSWALQSGKPLEGVSREVLMTLWADLGPQARKDLGALNTMFPPRSLEALYGYLTRSPGNTAGG